MPSQRNSGPDIEQRVLHVRQLTTTEDPGLEDPRNDTAWNRWVTTEVLEVIAEGPFEVSEGFRTDLASVPNAFSWFVPRAGRYARAAVLHDYLWSPESAYGLSRRDADRQFRVAMEHNHISLLRRWIMWAAVRGMSMLTCKAGSDWWKDAPLVLPILAFAAVFLSVPAAAIVVASVAFGLVERVVWGIMRLLPVETEPQPRVQFRT